MTELTFEPPTTERLGTLLSDHPPAAPGGGRVDAVNVSQHVGARQILQELSLSVEPGELVAIAGGSGAGKSTLLEILAGLQPPSAGQVRHDGRLGRDGRLVPLDGGHGCQPRPPRSTTPPSSCWMAQPSRQNLVSSDGFRR